MINASAEFTFKVPEGHAQAGEKIVKSFQYRQTENDADLAVILAEKEGKEGWSHRELVDEKLKANAKASAYQTTLAVYRPSEVSAEDIKERMVRDYIRLGATEEAARAQVNAFFASTETDSE